MPIVTLSTNLWLENAQALQSVLQANLSDIITAVNLVKAPSIPITVPTVGVELGISSEIINRVSSLLPALAVGIYERIPTENYEEDAAQFRYPYILEAYLTNKDRTKLFIQAIKWGAVFDTFINQFTTQIASAAGSGLWAYEKPKIDATMLLKRSDGYRQLVTAVGDFHMVE